jgi:Glyoxalase/Bleomycin resistance protein/Dioxygenase superfamily
VTDPFRLYQQPFPSGDYCYTQLAFVVPDVIAAAHRWVDVHGVGPFFVLPDRGPATVRYRGTKTSLHTRIAVSQAGPLQLELIEQLSVDTPSVFRELYGPSDVGAHHLCTMTADYDVAVAHYESRGYSLVAELDAPGLGRVGYVDTSRDFGLMTEVVQWSDAFHTMLSKTARVCAGWDGTDPVRLMRETGGYDSA